MLVDVVLMEQVLVNLLENAAKYAPQRSSIELRVALRNNAVEIAVADRGLGISADEEQHIFERFYQLQPDQEGGVGLGLTICRGIIEAHGGRIWLEERPGGGAVFRLTLPLEDNPPTVEPARTERDRAAT